MLLTANIQISINYPINVSNTLWVLSAIVPLNLTIKSLEDLVIPAYTVSPALVITSHFTSSAVAVENELVTSYVNVVTPVEVLPPVKTTLSPKAPCAVPVIVISVALFLVNVIPVPSVKFTVLSAPPAVPSKSNGTLVPDFAWAFNSYLASELVV